jgi:hypothetical protein
MSLSLSRPLSLVSCLLSGAVFSCADPSVLSFDPLKTGLARSSKPPPKYSLPTPFGTSAQSALAHLRLRAQSSASEEGATSVGLPAGMLLGKRAPRTVRRSGGRLAASKTDRWMPYERSLSVNRGTCKHQGKRFWFVRMGRRDLGV